jgi:hypothetical protein
MRLKMIIELHLNSQINIKNLRKYSCIYDSGISVLVDICRIISENKVNKFKFIAFSDTEWPVDIETDLSIFMEQLPSCIREISNDENASIYLYEQGINREIFFENQGNIYRCYALGYEDNWKSMYDEYLTKIDLLNILNNVLSNFINILDNLSENKYLLDWLAGDKK